MIDDLKLYNKVVEEAKKIYPKSSAYRSGWIVRTYKKRGGTYSGTKTDKGLTRWFEEKWRDIGNEGYPVYRPTKRIDKNTPLTVKEIDFSNLKNQIALKQIYKSLKNLPAFKRKT